jgi:hypothetical protein
VEPDHDGALLVVVDSGSPDVEAEAVLAGSAIVPGEHLGFFVVLPAVAVGLRAAAAVVHGATEAGPRFGFLRRHETGRAAGVVAVGNAFEGDDTVADIAANLAQIRFDDGLGCVSNDWVIGQRGAPGPAAQPVLPCRLRLPPVRVI